MSEVIIVSVIVALSASLGGLISMFAREEIEKYDKPIKYGELFFSIILAILMITIYKSAWLIFFLILGAAITIVLNHSLFHIHLNRYIRMLMYGLALGILLSIDRSTAFLFGGIVALHNIVKGSRIGAFYIPKKINIFKKISEFQVLFILAALIGFYFITMSTVQVAVLNFTAGAVVATVVGTKI